MSELPATVISRMRSFSRISACSARAEPEVEPSTTASTPCVSIQPRAIETAMSGLFWWSADRISTRAPPP